MILFRTVIAFLLGAVVSAAIQPFLPTGWWLNSGAGVAMTSIVVFLLTLMLASRESTRVAIALWVGTVIGTSVILLRVGPGTIFPIVMAFGAIWSAGIIAFGVVARSWILRTIGSPSQSP
jgi:hypothetical protein